MRGKRELATPPSQPTENPPEEEEELPEDENEEELAAALDDFEEEDKRPEDERYYERVDHTAEELGNDIRDYFDDNLQEVEETFNSLSEKFAPSSLDQLPTVRPDLNVIHGQAGKNGIHVLTDTKTRKYDDGNVDAPFVPSLIAPPYFSNERAWLLDEFNLGFFFQLDQSEMNSLRLIPTTLRSDPDRSAYEILGDTRLPEDEKNATWDTEYTILSRPSVPPEFQTVQQLKVAEIEQYVRNPTDYQRNRKLAIPSWDVVSKADDRVSDEKQKQVLHNMRVVKELPDDITREVSEYVSPPLDTPYATYNLYEERLRTVLGFYNIWGAIDVRQHILKLYQYQVVLKMMACKINLSKQPKLIDVWIQSEKANRLLVAWYYEIPFWMCCVYALINRIYSSWNERRDSKLNGEVWRCVNTLYYELKRREMERLIYYGNRFGQNLFYLNQSEDNIHRLREGNPRTKEFPQPLSSTKWMKRLHSELRDGSLVRLDPDGLKSYAEGLDAEDNPPLQMGYYKEFCRIDLDESVYRSINDIAPWSNVGIGAWSLYIIGKADADRARPSKRHRTWYHLRRLRRAVRDRFKLWVDIDERKEMSELRWVVDDTREFNISRSERYLARSTALHKHLMTALDTAQNQLHPNRPDVMTRKNLRNGVAKRLLPIVALRRPDRDRNAIADKQYQDAQRQIVGFLYQYYDWLRKDIDSGITREDIRDYEKKWKEDPSDQRWYDLRHRVVDYVASHMADMDDDSEAAFNTIRQFMDNVLIVDTVDVPQQRRVTSRKLDNFMTRGRIVAKQAIAKELDNLSTTDSLITKLVWRDSDFQSAFQPLETEDRKINTPWLNSADNPEGLIPLIRPREGVWTRYLRDYPEFVKLYENSPVGPVDQTTRRLAYRRALQYLHLRDVLERLDNNPAVTQKWLRLYTSLQPPYLLDMKRGSEPPLRVQPRHAGIIKAPGERESDVTLRDYTELLRDYDMSLYIEQSFQMLHNRREALQDALGMSVNRSERDTQNEKKVFERLGIPYTEPSESDIPLNSGRAFWRLVAAELTTEDDEDDSDTDADADIWSDDEGQDSDKENDDTDKDKWKINRQIAHNPPPPPEPSKRKKTAPATPPPKEEDPELQAYLYDQAIEKLSSVINWIAAAEEYETNLKALSIPYLNTLTSVNQEDGVKGMKMKRVLEQERKNDIDDAFQMQEDARKAEKRRQRKLPEPETEEEEKDTDPPEEEKEEEEEEEKSEIPHYRRWLEKGVDFQDNPYTREAIQNNASAIKTSVDDGEYEEPEQPEVDDFVEEDREQKEPDIERSSNQEYLEALRQIEREKLDGLPSRAELQAQRDALEDAGINPAIRRDDKTITDEEPPQDLDLDLDITPLTTAEVLEALQSELPLSEETNSDSSSPATTPAEEFKAMELIRNWVDLTAVDWVDLTGEDEKSDTQAQKRTRTGAHLEIVDSESDDGDVTLQDSWLWMADLYLDIGQAINSKEFKHLKKQCTQWEMEMPEYLLSAMRSDQVMGIMAKPVCLIQVQFDWLHHHHRKPLEAHHLKHMKHKADELFNNPPIAGHKSPYRTYSRDKVQKLAKMALAAWTAAPAPSSAMVSSSKTLISICDLLVTTFRGDDQVHGALWRIVIVSILAVGDVNKSVSVSGGKEPKLRKEATRIECIFPNEPKPSPAMQQRVNQLFPNGNKQKFKPARAIDLDGQVEDGDRPFWVSADPAQPLPPAIRKKLTSQLQAEEDTPNVGVGEVIPIDKNRRRPRRPPPPPADDSDPETPSIDEWGTRPRSQVTPTTQRPRRSADAFIGRGRYTSRVRSARGESPMNQQRLDFGTDDDPISFDPTVMHPSTLLANGRRMVPDRFPREDEESVSRVVPPTWPDQWDAISEAFPDEEEKYPDVGAGAIKRRRAGIEGLYDDSDEDALPLSRLRLTEDSPIIPSSTAEILEELAAVLTELKEEEKRPPPQPTFLNEVRREINNADALSQLNGDWRRGVIERRRQLD